MSVGVSADASIVRGELTSLCSSFELTRKEQMERRGERVTKDAYEASHVLQVWKVKSSKEDVDLLRCLAHDGMIWDGT